MCCETQIPQAATISKMAIFLYMYKGHGQEHKVIDLSLACKGYHKECTWHVNTLPLVWFKAMAKF